MKTRCEIGKSSEGSRCWHCNRRLQRARGIGLVYFVTAFDKDGGEHRAHAECDEEEQEKVAALIARQKVSEDARRDVACALSNDSRRECGK